MKNDEYIQAVKKHSNRLYLIALSYTKSHYDAEDIVQDVFLKLWSKDINFNDYEHLNKWLTVVCINKCKDYSRTSFFRRNVTLDEAKALYTFDSPADFDIFNAIMELPKKERVVVHLFYYDDLPVKEIANILKINESSVKTRLHRARTKLKEKLGDDWIYEQ